MHNTEKAMLEPISNKDGEPSWLALPLEEFMQQAEVLLSENALLPNETFWQDTLKYLEKKSMVKYVFVLYRVAEAELLWMVTADDAANSKKESYVVGEMMESYICTGRRFYEALYRPECFSKQGIGWMPKDCRYNDILVRFLNSGKLKLSMLLEAAKLKPAMVPVIKAWLAELAKNNGRVG